MSHVYNVSPHTVVLDFRCQFSRCGNLSRLCEFSFEHQITLLAPSIRGTDCHDDLCNNQITLVALASHLSDLGITTHDFVPYSSSQPHPPIWIQDGCVNADVFHLSTALVFLLESLF